MRIGRPLSELNASHPLNKRLVDGGAFGRSRPMIWVPMGSRIGYPTALSDGVIQAATFRQFHHAQDSIETVRLLFSNPRTLVGVGNETTYQASVETGNFATDPTGASTTCTPITFSGEDTLVLPYGEFVLSDPVNVTVAAGATFCTRVYASLATAGHKWANNIIRVGDYAPGAAYPWGLQRNQNLAHGGAMPNAGAPGLGVPGLCGVLVGKPAGHSPMVAVLGDSISAGQSENEPLTAYYGWSERVFRPSNSTFGHLRIGVPSLTSTGWTDTGSDFYTQILNLVQTLKVKHCICQLGINDLSIGGGGVTLAAMQGKLTTIWDLLREYGVQKVYQTTLTPYATSTDSWATLANQTPASPTGNEATRTAFNDWIRTTPDGIDGYYDLADACESSRNSGKWKVDGTAFYATADAIHPISRIHTMMAQAVNHADFT